MAALRALNLALAFLLELALLAALAVWGLSLDGPWRWPVAVLGPVVVVAVWGRWLAPRASRRLSGAALVAAKVALYAVGAAALVGAGLAAWAAWFGAAAVVNLVLASVWRQEEVA